MEYVGNLIEILVFCCHKMDMHVTEADLRTVLAQWVISSNYYRTKFAMENSINPSAAKALDIEKYICSKFYTGDMGTIIEVFQDVYKVKVSIFDMATMTCYSFGKQKADAINTIPYFILKKVSPNKFLLKAIKTYNGTEPKHM